MAGKCQTCGKSVRGPRPPLRGMCPQCRALADGQPLAGDWKPAEGTPPAAVVAEVSEPPAEEPAQQ